MTRFTPVGFVTACLLLPLTGFAQSAQPAKPWRYRLELGRYFAASGQTPFWLRANQYGLVPRQAPLLTFRPAIGMDYHPAPSRPVDSLYTAQPRIDWGWGLQAVFNGGETNQLLLAQAFLKLKIGPGLELWAGRREELVGLVDSTLTSGSYAWSGNTRPMPKIQLALPDYLPRRGLFSIKGFYGHGWFEPDRLFKNMLLHQKALYGRVGKPHWRLKLFGGINHQVMWGGAYGPQPGIARQTASVAQPLQRLPPGYYGSGAG